MQPGIDDNFDPPCLNIHCEGVIGRKDFKPGGVNKKSYGFPFVGPVSMETLMTFEPKCFILFSLSRPHSYVVDCRLRINNFRILCPMNMI